MKSERSSDTAFRTLLVLGGIAVSVLLIAIFSLLITSRPAIVANGFRFSPARNGTRSTESFHSLAFVAGTLITSLIALVIATILSLALAILMGKYSHRRVQRDHAHRGRAAGGIRSVVYGFIGLFFRARRSGVGDRSRPAAVWSRHVHHVAVAGLHDPALLRFHRAGDHQPRSVGPQGSGALTRGDAVGDDLEDHARRTPPRGSSAGSCCRSGRALGETMAVTMVIGNANVLTFDVFAPGNTMASVIANEFSEATTNVYLSSLIEIGLLLFIVSTLINIAGKIVVNRMAAR